jgi:hypothetical protein
MFNFIYSNLNSVNKPSLISKVNIWFFLNNIFLKNKYSNNIIYFLEHMSNLKFKSIKVYWDLSNFEVFFSFFIKYVLLILIVAAVLV